MKKKEKMKLMHLLILLEIQIKNRIMIFQVI